MSPGRGTKSNSLAVVRTKLAFKLETSWPSIPALNIGFAAYDYYCIKGSMERASDSRHILFMGGVHEEEFHVGSL